MAPQVGYRCRADEGQIYEGWQLSRVSQLSGETFPGTYLSLFIFIFFCQIVIQMFIDLLCVFIWSQMSNRAVTLGNKCEDK